MLVRVQSETIAEKENYVEGIWEQEDRSKETERWWLVVVSVEARKSRSIHFGSKVNKSAGSGATHKPEARGTSIAMGPTRRVKSLLLCTMYHPKIA